MGICNSTYLLGLPLAPKIDADLLWDLSFVFSGLGLLYLVCVFVFRNRLSHKKKGIRLRKKELGPMISNFLFYDDDASLQEKYDHVQLKLEIRELLKDDFNRKVLVEILLDLRKDISGDARLRLFSLYKDLGLHLDAFEKLKSRRWHIISQGILELTQLQVEESYGFIKKFINHRRGVIRKQAQMATVNLKHEGIEYFLDTCKHRISEWQQLKLLDIIRHLEDFQPPRFKAWLTAKNKDVVLFSLRLIKYYKQNDANSSLIELVKHKNDQIKIEAINCIKEFVVFDALDTLKSVFWNCSPPVKLLLLDTVASLGEEKEISFLKMVENKENNFMVKSKAISAINTISPEAVMPTHEIVSYPDYDASQELLEDFSGPVAEQALNLTTETATSAVEDIKKASPIAMEEEMIGFTEDIESIEKDAVNEEFELWDIATQLTTSEDSISKGENVIDDQEANINTDVSQKETFDLTELQEIVFPLQEDAPDFNDQEEIVMENKDEIQFDNEEPLESLQNIGLPNLNSEEAYWEAVLDPENEDEVIFDLCFMEELDEILTNADRPDHNWAPHEILPIDFLPIIQNEDSEMAVEEIKKADPIFDIEVIEEVVHQDELFAEELHRILERIKDADNQQQEAVPNFIPLVVDSNEEEITPALLQIEVIEEDPELHEEEQSNKQEQEELAIQLPWENNRDLNIGELEEENLYNLELEYEEINAPILADNKINKEKEALFELSTELEERLSIFNELFRTCDAESKLILLDEILAVGDERDLKFLATLADDEDERVRLKALKIGEELKAYLDSKAAYEQQKPSHKNDESQISSDKGIDITSEHANVPEDDIFEIEFELEARLSKENDSDGRAQIKEKQTVAGTTSLLEGILSFPSKVLDKFNG